MGLYIQLASVCAIRLVLLRSRVSDTVTFDIAEAPQVGESLSPAGPCYRKDPAAV